MDKLIPTLANLVASFRDCFARPEWATGRDGPGAFAISGYCRQCGIEMAFFESQQFVGLHDPRVRVVKSVERAHPLAWFVQTLMVVWYAESDQGGPHVVRDEGGGDVRPHAGGVAIPAVGRIHFAGTGWRTNSHGIAKPLGTPSRRRAVTPKYESEAGATKPRKRTTNPITEWPCKGDARIACSRVSRSVTTLAVADPRSSPPARLPVDEGRWTNGRTP